MLERALANHRSRLVLIAATAMLALAALAAASVVTQRDDRASAKEPPASLGLDLVHCPKAEPEKLPPDALASATSVGIRAYVERR